VDESVEVEGRNPRLIPSLRCPRPARPSGRETYRGRDGVGWIGKREKAAMRSSVSVWSMLRTPVL